MARYGRAWNSVFTWSALATTPTVSINVPVSHNAAVTMNFDNIQIHK